MTPALLLPAALAALGALLVPLLIHLARRSQRQPTVFAALRWLRSEARPQRRIRLEELLLLALRLLLIALLALWLARPVLFGGQAAPHVVAAVPGVDAAAVQALAEETDVPARWLAPGFPELGQPVPDGPLPVASLLRELDAQLPDGATLTVAVPDRLEGMDAQRPVLSRPVEWRVLTGAMAAPEPLETTPPALQVRHDGNQAQALRYLLAAALSWYEAGELPDGAFEVEVAESPVDGDSSHLLWLVEGEVPAEVIEWVQAGGVALLGASTDAGPSGNRVTLWRDARGEALVEGGTLGSGRLMRFTRPLQPALMPELLEADFPRRLREVLAGPAPAPASVAASGHAPLTGAAAYPSPPRDLRPWLALLVALVLLAERWVATSRRRGASS